VVNEPIGLESRGAKVGPFELTEARALFESESAALAAPIISEEALAELERLIQIMSGKLKVDGINDEEADRLFHLTIAKATNNVAIIFTIENMWKMRSDAMEVQTVYESVCHSDSVLLEKEHRAILDALRSKDSSKARKTMRAHFTRMIEALLVASEEAAYNEVKRKSSERSSRFLLSAQID